MVALQEELDWLSTVLVRASHPGRGAGARDAAEPLALEITLARRRSPGRGQRAASEASSPPPGSSAMGGAGHGHSRPNDARYPRVVESAWRF